MKDNTKSDALTILVLTVALNIAYLAWHHEWLLYTSIILAILSIASSHIRKTIHWLWMGLTRILAAIFPKLILGFFYFAILTPIATLFKLSGGKSTYRRQDVDGSTYRETSEVTQKEDFEKIW